VADPLKHSIDEVAVRKLGASFASVEPSFHSDRFVRRATRGLEPLELMERARHVAAALDEQLPRGDEALDTFVASLGQPLADGEMGGMLFFVHSCWLTERARGADFDRAMAAAAELTRRFTSEFALRPLIERDAERALAWLQMWAADDDPHVRRLVSEGTRPRLPWAPRLSVFLEDYAPVAELLHQLKGDPSLYVRRSVANHVGDLAKVDLALAVDLCRRWARDDSPDVQWVVKHALRHPLKQGHPEVLALFGHHGDPELSVSVTLGSARVERGGTVDVEVEVRNPHDDERSALIDLIVDFVKANGKTRPKVFKLRSLTLDAGAHATLRKRVSLEDLSTRRHYPGVHDVRAQVNGKPVAGASFTLS
jgi:3-methyladenine DNA glycosylase AlkC